jgi:hypothetical protein
MSARRLDADAATKLAKVLALLGSPHDGERASAGLLADRIVRAAGLSWADVIVVADDNDTPPPGHRELAVWLLQRLPNLGERDREFLSTMSTWWREPSLKQIRWLDGLRARATAGRAP